MNLITVCLLFIQLARSTAERPDLNLILTDQHINTSHQLLNLFIGRQNAANPQSMDSAVYKSIDQIEERQQKAKINQVDTNAKIRSMKEHLLYLEQLKEIVKSLIAGGHQPTTESAQKLVEEVQESVEKLDKKYQKNLIQTAYNSVMQYKLQGELVQEVHPPIYSQELAEETLPVVSAGLKSSKKVSVDDKVKDILIYKRETALFTTNTKSISNSNNRSAVSNKRIIETDNASFPIYTNFVAQSSTVPESSTASEHFLQLWRKKTLEDTRRAKLRKTENIILYTE